MATPIYKTLGGLALALVATALPASDSAAQERGPRGGVQGRQFEPGARGAGGPRSAGRAPRAANGDREGVREDARSETEGSEGEVHAEAHDDAPSPAPMQFDNSPVRGTVAAAPVIAPQRNGWLDEIAEIEARVALLEKREDLDTRLIDSQIRMLEKRAELESLTREDLATRLVDAQITLRQKRAELDALNRESTDAMLAYLPSVISIIGTAGKYRSQLYFPSGRMTYARPGDLIAPGVRVTAVSPAGVEVNMVLGDSKTPQQVPLSFVSLPERRGENDEAQAAPAGPMTLGDFFRNMAANRAAGAAPANGAR